MAHITQGTLTLRNAIPDEVSHAFDIIVGRIQWMDLKGIRQWNVTRYLERFPYSYYVEKQQSGELYLLLDHSTLLATAVLKTADDRWPAEAHRQPALYLHNFATVPGHPGSGLRFLALAEQLTAILGYHFLRLDCADDNPFLNNYYHSLGYSPAGTCTHGLYHGILRQKKMPPKAPKS